ncbi:DUF6153 family protein [Streptomyces sp. NPDC004647]|uniref:DUF6153 family protein n=1 Tax=Streptomyces sp. NPDC004647 TaxID=3154671 RepID=UPI0033B30FB7
MLRAVKPFGLRSYLLLVLAVLAGLVAMHGLGPGAAVPVGAHAVATSHHAPAAGHEQATASGAPCQSGCVHADDPAGSGRGGHAQHADATCAAAGTAGAPALPAPSCPAAPTPRRSSRTGSCPTLAPADGHHRH